MRVIEQTVVCKWNDPGRCEDGIVLTPHFAGVIDGATDITASVYQGMTPGRFAMLTVSGAIEDLAPHAGALDAIGALSRILATHVPAGVEPAGRPGAAATIYSASRRELWQVGDVGYWYPGLPAVPVPKLVDDINTRMRCAVITAALLGGATPLEILREDPGRSAIVPLLRAQAQFANTEDARAGELAFGVLDGRPVPATLVSVITVPDDVHEVVIASDGYPALLPTLTQAEDHLAELLARDPMCMGELAGTKAVAVGAVSFDDRAYLRLAV
jgi:hypothetical protein